MTLTPSNWLTGCDLLRLAGGLCVVLCLVRSAHTAELEWLRVSDDGKEFVTESGKPFVAWGFNYDHDRDGRLIEDYWETEWAKVEGDFREMKTLGANVVRIHLQFGKFMQAADEPNRDSLARLERLVALADETGLYLDLTGLGCYHKQDVPAWYDQLDEQGRWKAQAAFWEAIAETCRDSPAVFFYDLMNEPVAPVGQQKEWLPGKPLGDKYFVQRISLEQAGRDRAEIARMWIEQLTAAIRKHDKRHLVSVGLVEWSLERPGLRSGFVPSKIVDELDFICVHVYPKSGEIDESIETLKGFAVGKPVIVEETFSLKCSRPEFEEFLDRSQGIASGWIGFYWGKTPDELRSSGEFVDAFVLSGLEVFQNRSPERPKDSRPAE